MLGMMIYTEIIPAWKAESEGSFLMKDSTVKNILILGNLVAGFGAALIWVAQGDYISLCSTEMTKGFYFGYFWVWNKMAEVLGNLIGALAITKMSQNGFFILMSMIMTVPSAMFMFLKNP
jgi:hypothetical protein